MINHGERLPTTQILGALGAVGLMLLKSTVEVVSDTSIKRPILTAEDVQVPALQFFCRVGHTAFSR